MNSNATHIWYATPNGGETLQQREERIAKNWLRGHLSPIEQKIWLEQPKYTPYRRQDAPSIRIISQQDSAELVELLYPRFPALFRKAERYALSPSLFSAVYDGPFTEDVLQQCACSRAARLNAACLFALAGAADCLETLLEHGADPDGLESPDSWSCINLPNGRILPVSPMDCALLGDNENCQLLLELYGGKSLHQHLTVCE